MPLVSLHGLMPVEILILVYLLTTGFLMLGRRRNLPRWPIHLLIRGLAIAFVYTARWLPLPVFLRDWYPMGGYLFFYEEIRWLNRLITQRFYDRVLIAVEDRLFRGQPSLYLSERLPFLWLADFLYLSYFFYYVLTPSVGLSLYVLGQYAAFRETLFVLMLTFHVCFWCFIFFPVAGPHYEFPLIGKPFSDRLFYRLTHRVIAHGASKGAAFPSSHVAVGVSALMCLGQFNVPLSLAFAPLIIGLVVGTVYGRFHYAIDAFAGIAVGAACYPLGRWLYLVLQRVVG